MLSKPNYNFFKPDYEMERAKLLNFLKTFVDRSIERDRIHDQRKYMIELVSVKFNFSKKLPINNQNYWKYMWKTLIASFKENQTPYS